MNVDTPSDPLSCVVGSHGILDFDLPLTVGSQHQTLADMAMIPPVDPSIGKFDVIVSTSYSDD